MPDQTQLPDSDLPYVRGLNAAERSSPVTVIEIAPKGGWTDRSGTLGNAGEAVTVFAAVDDHSVTSRNVQNINDEGNLWVNYHGQDAVPGAPGCYKVVPGALLTVPSLDEVSLCGDVDGMKFTAGEC